MSEIGGSAGSETRPLCRRVDGDEDDVSLGNVELHVGAEEEVSVSALLDNVKEAGLEHGEMVAVPRGDPGGGGVDDDDLDGGAF